MRMDSWNGFIVIIFFNHTITAAITAAVVRCNNRHVAHIVIGITRSPSVHDHITWLRMCVGIIWKLRVILRPPATFEIVVKLMRPTVSAQRVFEINIMATEKRRVRLKRALPDRECVGGCGADGVRLGM